MDSDTILGIDSEFNTFEDLLKASLERSYPATQFFNLFQEFKSKQEEGDNLNHIALFQNIDKNQLQRSYVHELFVKSDIENSCEELTNYFTTVVNQIPVTDQILVQMLINQNKSIISWKNYSQNSTFLHALANYSNDLMKSFDESRERKRLTFLFVKLLSNILSNAIDVKLDESFLHAALELSENLTSKGLTTEHKLLQTQLNYYNMSVLKSGFVLNQNDSSNRSHDGTLKLTDKGNPKTFKMEKILWLSQKVLIEYVTLDSQFITDFKTLIKLSNISTLESVSTVVIELFTTLFDCLQISSTANFHIWREYAINKIPLFLKNELKVNQVKLEKALSTLLHDDPSLLNLHRELLEEMEKSLIDLELLTHESLKINPNAMEIDTKLTVEELSTEYTQKFMDCNPEFTSIEEIEIEGFLQKIKTSVILRHKFSQLVIESVSSFILTGDSLRLRRLIISISIDFDILDAVMLHEGPQKMLFQLLKFLNSTVSNTPEGVNGENKYTNQNNNEGYMMDFDIASDDSSNTQENLCDISTICLFIKVIFTRYNFIPKNTEFDEFNHVMPLLHSAKLSSDHKGNHQNIKETDVDETTLNKWILSMFDSNNTDGISDSLIKESTPIQYSILIPKVVKDAIFSHSIGWMDEETLNGGLEYLHQKFLTGWLVFIIQEFVNLNLESNNDKIPTIIANVLKQLFTVNESESTDVKVVIKLSKYVMNDCLWANFPSLRSEFTPPAPVSMFEDTLKGLVTYVNFKDKNESLQDIVKFDITSAWKVLKLQKSPMEFLYYEAIQFSTFQPSQSDIYNSLITFLLLLFAKWQLGDEITITWSQAFAQLNDPDANLMSMIFNRHQNQPVLLGTGSTDADTNGTSTFFGFIQDPDTANESGPTIENKDDSLDTFGNNLVVLAYQNKGNALFDAFAHKLMDHLK